MWERLLLASRFGGASRDQTIAVLERRLFVAGKPLPREILAKLTALGQTPVPFSQSFRSSQAGNCCRAVSSSARSISDLMITSVSPGVRIWVSLDSLTAVNVFNGFVNGGRFVAFNDRHLNRCDFHYFPSFVRLSLKTNVVS